MPSTPTTKSQVQAYQFVLRRMQSALVRRDAVMLHDPMRTHSRATLVGIVLAVLGMLGFVIFGLISPSPSPPASGIVIGAQSGTVYVKSDNPSTLTPTFNLASARLLLMARQQTANQQTANQQTGQATAPAANVKVEQPQVIPDSQLENIPRGRLTGIIDGPQLLPDENQRVANDWSVCDLTQIDSALPPQVGLSQAKTQTTVFAGSVNLGRELGQNEALLVSADNQKSYLIYRQQANPNRPNVNTVRAQVDLSQPSVTAALRLTPQRSRHISMGMLNAIPEVGQLKSPDIANRNSTPQFNLAGFKVGDVFAVSRAGAPDYWVVLTNGIQQISSGVADLIRYQNSGGQVGPIPQVTPDRIQQMPQIAAGAQGALSIEDYPQEVPTVLDPSPIPSSCLSWTEVNPGTPNADGHTAVYVSAQAPKPTNAQGTELTSLDIAQPSPDGVKIDKFFLQPGRAAVVRSVTSQATFASGPISLISDRGLRYGVPDVNTANGLGLNNPQPAPDAIIRLLPTGASLNTADVQRSYDSIPSDPNAGSFVNQTSGTGN
jgi:type VII secretion protein EccB